MTSEKKATASRRPSVQRVPASAAQPHTTEALQVAFVSMAIGMAWQLAITVLVPLLGGYFLDQRFHTSPLYILVGMVISVICSAFVLRQAVRAASQYTAGDTDKGVRQ